jgi:carbonic anhydrase
MDIKMLGILALVSIYIQQISSQTSEWDYFEGGDDWTGICASGSSQSPIDLKDSIVTKITSEDDKYSVTLNLVGDFTAEWAQGDTGSLGISGSFGSVKINDKTISVTNFHFHSPSEHTINGDYLDIELHFIGADEDQKFYEMAFLFKADEDENKFIENAISSFSEGKSKSFDTAWLMENGVVDSFYYYEGSISAPFPDCYENTGWMLIADILEMSQEQLDFFSDMYKNNKTFAGGRGNNRKIQKLNDRKVYLHIDESESSSFGIVLASSVISVAGLFLF